MVDLWLMQSQRYIDIALEEGFRKFTFHMVPLWRSKLEMFSWMRANTAAYGPVKFMLIDHTGAPEYSTFGRYEKPDAVYPTWSPDEGEDQLEALMLTNVAEDKELCSDIKIFPEMRPVYGQKHRVVVHRIPGGTEGRQEFILRMRMLQLKYPDCELFISGMTRFNDLFGLGFKAVDYLPSTLTTTGADNKRVALPTGKVLVDEVVYDPRYSDWFDLIGMQQYEVVNTPDRIKFCLRSARWAARNFENVKPFVARTSGSRWGPNTVIMSGEFTQVSDKDFILPAARRRVMRNIGLKPDEYDRFTCDTCILHNACTLYREGSVCTVKGSDTVALADAFGSRNADVIMDGLTQLLKRNAERLEDAMASEEAAGELDPEVTKLGKVVFDQGVKLAKLRDPKLAGGPKVQVNVGVSGNAQVGIASTNPKELTASIVAELEASGIPREEIDSAMIKGVLRNMAQVGQQQAISSAATKHQMKASPKVIPGSTV